MSLLQTLYDPNSISMYLLSHNRTTRGLLKGMFPDMFIMKVAGISISQWNA